MKERHSTQRQDTTLSTNDSNHELETTRIRNHSNQEPLAPYNLPNLVNPQNL